MAKRIRPARSYQHPQAPIRVAADNAKPALKRAFKTALKVGRRLFDADKARDLMFQGRVQEVADLTIDYNHIDESMKHPLGMLGDVWLAGGQIGARKINGSFVSHRRVVRYRKSVMGERVSHDGQLTMRGQISGMLQLRPNQRGAPILSESWLAATIVEKDQADLFNFDRFDPATQAHIRDYQDALIKQLGESSRQVIEDTIINAMRLGFSADDIVDQIRAVIGLTDRQAAAVLNFRNMLMNSDPEALRRQLANSDDMDTFKQAISNGRTLDQATVDQMVSNYENNYLDYRAQSIADTEATRAANLGLRDSYQQAVDRGVMPSEAVTRHWQISLDEKTCDHCLSVVDDNPDGIPLDGEYDSDDGPIDGPPYHTNCRCSEEFVTNLDLVPTDADFEG